MDDFVERLRYWVCKFFKKSERKDEESDAMIEAVARIKTLETALLFMVRNEEVHKKIAEMQGEPYVNKGLDYAKSLLAGEKKDV